MRFQNLSVSLTLAALLFHPAGEAQQSVEPPYGGTVYVDSGWITPNDPSTFVDKIALGIERVTLFDRRVADFTDVDAHSYRLEFESGVVAVARVNTEFDEPVASQLAEKWGFVLGQLPLGLIDQLGELQICSGIRRAERCRGEHS